MAVPHYTYLVLKMPGPKGIITVKGSFEVSDLCDKEFHKMAQNFGMIANYEEPKEKAKIATTEVDKLPEGRPAEPETKKPQVQPPKQEKSTREEEKTQAT
jgi:nitrous oxide reductase accessory protein NosL